ncbi:PASTA domain-containing protein [Microbacterium pumilum]|uniref:PASTA domain-containing protein n=1 Tax=Microbacterium pumilum TaxID=344165 RepID=A0ABN2RV86_9MICO
MSSGGDFGPVDPAVVGGPPFAVAGPSTVALDGARAGSGSFTVSNVTGRPVRARVMVVPSAGADASWFQVVGESERSLPVAGTATVDVTVKVAEKAPAGAFSFAVGAALEEAPDQVVSGPTVAFQVPEPKKRKFPWWIVIVAAVALLLLIGGGITIWLLMRTPAAPTMSQAPTVSGTVQVGAELAVAPGVWDPDDSVLVHTWQACPDAATDEDDAECADIIVGTGEDAASARGPTYVVGADVVGMRIRVVETAVRVDPETFGEDGPDDLSDLPNASASSAMTDPVVAAPPTTAEVPPVETLPYSQAVSLLSAAGFQVVRTTSDEIGECDPDVVDQSPDGFEQAPIGSVVGITTLHPPELLTCIGWIQKDDLVITNDWFFEQVGP